MSLRSFILAAAIVPVMAGTAFAEPILGIWATEPDGKAQIGHIEMRACGPAICGKLVRAYASNGAQVTTPNVGREMIWDLRPAGGGKYGNGRILVPVMGADFPVEMTLAGDTLSLRACNALGICRSQTWSRAN